MKALLVTVSALAICSLASAESLKTTVEKAYKLSNAALVKKDINAFVKAMKPTVTSDFKYVERGQAMDFDKMVAGMKMGLGSMSKVTASVSKLKSVKETGDTGVIKGFHSMSGMVLGPDKKSHLMEYGGNTTELFKKVGGVWKMTKMVWEDSIVKMDGKPFDPSKASQGK